MCKKLTTAKYTCSSIYSKTEWFFLYSTLGMMADVNITCVVFSIGLSHEGKKLFHYFKYVCILFLNNFLIVVNM